jgi:L-fuconolactonase
MSAAAIAITDSHVHLWDPALLSYPWLACAPALNRPFLMSDFRQASAEHRVDKMIFVECGCDPAQSLAEVDWVATLSKAEPRLKGMVAQAPVEKGADVRDDLEKLAGRPLVKGVRRNVQGETDPDFCLRPKFVAGVRQLAEFNFSFDLCVRAEQLPGVTKLVRQIPEVSFVLDHFGKPAVRDQQIKPWADDLKDLAALPNVVGKISGLTTEADWNHWRPDDLKFYFDHVLECFGVDRVLFGSDWPVMTLATSYRGWLDTVQGLLTQASDRDRTKLFHTNAERIYHV